MKRFTATLLTAFLLLASLSVFAEPVLYEEQGINLDFSDIEAKSLNYPYLMNYGVFNHEPFMAMINVVYYTMPRDTVEALNARMESAEGEEEYAALVETMAGRSASIGAIVVTNAKTLAEVEVPDPLPEGCTLTEFGTSGEYRYYFFTEPANELLAIYDANGDTAGNGASSQEMKDKTRADIRMVQEELLKKLQEAALFEPVDTDKGFIGRVIDFESVDLNGNALRSSDLFKDNRITMVNLWGTWCINCMNEMAELAGIHTRLREKGCGIVGVEYERDPLETVADAARKVLADYGIAYPNAIIPENNPVFSEVRGYPTTFFVDSEGKILTYPIVGAAVDEYEATVEKLLAGEAVNAGPNTGLTANRNGEYRVTVYDQNGSPVKGAVIQLCDDNTCSFQKTKADGVVTFAVEAPKEYDIHVLKVPEGYEIVDGVYKTLNTFSDVNVFVRKAE